MKHRTTIRLPVLLVIAILLTACRAISAQPESTAAVADAESVIDPELNLQPTASATTTATPSAQSPDIEPTPTRRKLVRYISPVGGDDGNTNLRGFEALNEGRVVILSPYISKQESASDAAVKHRFDSGRVALRVEVRDVEVGDEDGDGIASVIFRVYDNLERDQGTVVYEQTDALPPYCLIPEKDLCQENDTDRCCKPLYFGLEQQWPDGTDLVDGDYRLEIEILSATGAPAWWQWRFSIEGAIIPTPTPTPSPVPTKKPPPVAQPSTDPGPPPNDQPSPGGSTGGYP